MQGQKEFEEYQAAYADLKTAQKRIEEPRPHWIHYRDHEAAQRAYQQAAKRWLEAA